MEFFIIVFMFIIGLIFGSFFNVVGIRVPQKITFSNDRSKCPNCNDELAWYELIPVFSYIFQKGKCRHCHKRISVMYPVIELLTGGLFVFSYVLIGVNFELMKALLLVSLSVIIFITDMKYMLIPNKILLFFLPLFLIVNVFAPIEPWWSPFLGAIVAMGIIALIILVSRGGMGAGDMKLFGILGLVLGLDKVLLAFFLSCLLGTVIGVILICFKIIDRKQPVPFGPYIVFATLLTYFFGDEMIHYYSTFFLFS